MNVEDNLFQKENVRSSIYDGEEILVLSHANLQEYVAFFQSLVDKISSCISGWQHNFLDIEGCLIVIKHILSSIPMHILSAINPPKQIIKKIGRLFSIFLWEQYEQEDKQHQTVCPRFCRPIRRMDLALPLYKITQLLSLTSYGGYIFQVTLFGLSSCV